MHDHDDNLIAELAGGQLSASESDSARAAIGTCPRCRAELDAQLSARASLRSLPKSTLTEFESARLHHVIEGQASTSRSWYVRLAPALGAAAAVVLVAGLGVALLQSDPEVAQVQDAVGEAAAPVAPEPPAASEQLEEPASTAAEASDLLRSAASAPVDFGERSEDELGVLLESIAEPVAEDTSAGSLTEATPRLAPECVEEAAGVHVGYATVSGVQIELYRTGDNQAAAYRSESCELVAQFP